MSTIYTGQGTFKTSHRFTREAGFARWTIALTIAGSIKISTHAGSHVMFAPTLSLIEPNTRYTASFGGKGNTWRESWIIFEDNPRWRQWLKWPAVIEQHQGVRALSLKNSEHQKPVIAALHDACTYNSQATLTPASRASLLANALERLLLLADHINPARQAAMMDERVRQAVEILASPDTLHITMDALADRLNVSASHLTHLFSQQVGQPPMQFHQQQRHRRAAELLLATNQSIAQIAQAAGYDNAFHFSARFRKWAGVSPRHFRNGNTDHTR